MRFGAGIIQAAGERDRDIVRRPRIDAAEVALFEIDAVAHSVDTRAHRHPVEGKALLVGFPHRGQNDRVDHWIAARQTEQPDAVLVGGQLERGAQRELIAAGLDLKRNDQGTLARLPIEPDVGAIDFHTGIFAVVIDDSARIREHLALQPLQHAIG
jgi:hypothetical protein